jgi:thymidylate synthase (FAD)
MRIISQSVEALWHENEPEILHNLSIILGTPYNKGAYVESKTKELIRSCIKKGHTSVLEHCNITLRCVTNIGTYKDFTRHRHCAFTIESTSFNKYDELVVILPDNVAVDPKLLETLETIQERIAITSIPPKYGRDYLPQCTAATMIMTTNIREWRYIIGLRGDPNDNPLTRDLRNKIWLELFKAWPFFFPIPTVDEEDEALIDDPMYIRNEFGDHEIARRNTHG